MKDEKEVVGYNNDVKIIKQAILESQLRAAKSVNQEQLVLYFTIGKFISENSRKGFWGTAAIDAISRQLQRELPGLRGFSSRNLKNMRTFYEEWQCLEPNSAVKTAELHKNQNSAVVTAELINDISDTICVPFNFCGMPNFPIVAFLSIGFTHHNIILSKAKDVEERKFYIQLCYNQGYNVEKLDAEIQRDVYHHQGKIPNNFLQTVPERKQALKAIEMFKDEYMLDFINVEELGARDEDVDERVVEQNIVANVKNFIMTFGKAFSFIGNQVHYDKLGHDHWVDLLFFNYY